MLFGAGERDAPAISVSTSVARSIPYAFRRRPGAAGPSGEMLAEPPSSSRFVGDEAVRSEVLDEGEAAEARIVLLRSPMPVPALVRGFSDAVVVPADPAVVAE